jgi:hypothetical protein
MVVAGVAQMLMVPQERLVDQAAAVLMPGGKEALGL